MTSTATEVHPATRRLPRIASFWLVGATLVAYMFAAGAPSPLYVVYQARFGFSAISTFDPESATM